MYPYNIKFKCLSELPEKSRKPEICLLAVKRNGNSLQYVPKDYITSEMCFIAINKDYKALQYVPEDLKTSEICLAAIRRHKRAYEYIPDNLKTYEYIYNTSKSNINNHWSRYYRIYFNLSVCSLHLNTTSHNVFLFWKSGGCVDCYFI